MIQTDELAAKAEIAVDRDRVEALLARVRSIDWKDRGTVAGLVETPVPHRHVHREAVQVVAGRGFAGDHSEKSYYRGEYVTGREVSAITADILDVLGVDSLVVGDNLITRGLDLRVLQEGDRLIIGEVRLERSSRSHRPCTTFRNRTSREAFAVAGRDGNRGALFIVRKGGTIHVGDPITLAPRGLARE